MEEEAVKPVLQGFALVWLGVLIGALAVLAYEEIQFRRVLRRLMREAYEATQNVREHR